MRIRLSTLAALSLAAACGFTLFQTSQNVQQAENQFHDVHAALMKEKEAIRVLETEWDYLNRPSRIEDLARQYLNMKAPEPKSLVRDSSDLPSVTLPVPARKPKDGVKPASMSGEVRKPAEAISPPMPAPVGNDTGKRFNALLNGLTGQNTNPGGQR